MAMSGFEGYEKRLELHFSGEYPVTGAGLRQLDINSLEKILHEVQCTIVSALGNNYLDSYVLSESSLFVYPTKIIIKTCGTTRLLKSVRPFLIYASQIGLTVTRCTYTRGSFIFPQSQPHPHTCFDDEVTCLAQNLPSHLCCKKASVMPSNLTSHSWHVFSASHVPIHVPEHVLFTIEVCMTELDRGLARKFFRQPDDGKNGDTAGEEMTEITGIRDLNPNAVICDFGFDPCGYSMNGIDGDRYSTIHVTPEDGFSYASFESIYDDCDEVAAVLEKLVRIFRPATMSVAITCVSVSDQVWRSVAGVVESVGMKCRSCMADEFPTGGNVVFQTFKARRAYEL